MNEVSITPGRVDAVSARGTVFRLTAGRHRASSEPRNLWD